VPRPVAPNVPRAAVDTVLHGVVREHLEAFLAAAAARTDGVGLPHFIEREFRALRCGLLVHGPVLRVRCDDCAFERLVPLSCKGRAVCASCGGRRMPSAPLTRELLRLADWLTGAGCTPGPRGECARRRLQTRLYLAAQYRRLVKRRDDKKAIVCVAYSILVIAYHVLRDGQSYRKHGGDCFDHLNGQRLTWYHTTHLAALGYTVTLTKCAA
jgi:hypothetical protein